MDEVRVFCGDVDRPTLIDESTILLDVAAAKNDLARVRLKAAEITRKMLGKIPDRLADLLDIACYVYCADQLTRRDTKRGGSVSRYSVSAPISGSPAG